MSFVKTALSPVIRPARIEDLPSLLALEEEAEPGVTSLSFRSETLERRLIDSKKAFSTFGNQAGHYLFCLEVEKEVVGMCGIVSQLGEKDPFFAYELQEEEGIPLLAFTRIETRPTEVGSLFLQETYRRKNLGKLLSFSRFLFLDSFPACFSNQVMAQLRGVNQNGVSPFWDAIGAQFIPLSFSEADALRAKSPEIIEERFPKHPIYLSELPKEAQEVLGHVHPSTLPALHMLEKQGFQRSSYFDLFDGGPHLYSRREQIDLIKKTQKGVVKEISEKVENREEGVISNTKKEFRAVLTSFSQEGEEIQLPSEAAYRLQVQVGDPIKVYRL
ncbi:MAG: Arginine N-succinyltransferase [Chlamydiae bacterium]|nr:Arginine N-succinyltransferase [Chlamydiota bacterium]